MSEMYWILILALIFVCVCLLRIGPRSEVHSWTSLRGWLVLSLGETGPLAPCPSRWPPASLALTGTLWDKDVRCHGDHIQENTGKEGRRRCNIQKYRFGPGEKLFLTCVSIFLSCVKCVISCLRVALPTWTALVKNEDNKVLRLNQEIVAGDSSLIHCIFLFC